RPSRGVHGPAASLSAFAPDPRRRPERLQLERLAKNHAGEHVRRGRGRGRGRERERSRPRRSTSSRPANVRFAGAVCRWATIIEEMAEERIRVALADDGVLLREGLASLLERSGFDVVGQCGDSARLLDLVRQQRPELVIVDIRMPPGYSTEGLVAAHQIRTELPDTAILVLSAHVEVEYAMDLLATGQRTGY